MQKISTGGKVLATLTALTFAGGGLLLLLGPTLLSPATWTTQHYLTILTVAGTILAGELANLAAHARRYVAALAFFVVFLGGTALVVFNSVGRQAEMSETTTLTVEASNRAITDKQNELDDARDRLTEANDYVTLFTNGGTDPKTGKKIASGCKGGCNDWKLRAKEVGAHVKELEGELAKLGPQKPVNAKADNIATLMATVFGVDHARAAAAASIIEPYLWTLFFEIGSVVAFGFLFRSGSRKAVKVAEPSATEKPSSTKRATLQPSTVELSKKPEAPTVAKASTVARNPRTVARTLAKPVATTVAQSAAEAEVAAIVARGEALPNQDDLAAHWSVHKSTASRWLRDMEAKGTITRTRDGRNKRVAGNVVPFRKGGVA